MTQQLRPPPTRPAAVPGERMTYQQFLRKDWENPHVEWVNGVAVMTAQISDEHNKTGHFLIGILTHFNEAHDLGELRSDPFQMKTGPKLPGRAPDILFVTQKNAHRLNRLYVDGPADLVVEIISLGSRSVDRGPKYDEYEQGGVKEYSLIDPERKHAEFNVLGRDGAYSLLPVEDGVIRSTVVKGLWVKVDWLWKRPPLLSVLKEWKLV
jgi:Uma2 family endonuclease